MSAEKPSDPGKPKKAPENLSFAALQEELGELPSRPAPVPAAEEAHPHGDEERSFRPGRRETAPVGVDELNARVLTGSAPKTRPMWVKGLWPGAASLILCVVIFTYGEIKTLQPYFSYGVMVIGGFTMIWGADGLRRTDWEPKERYLCAVPLVMGFASLVIAFFSRH